MAPSAHAADPPGVPLDLRITVEAMRLGVVPPGQTHRYTVGRDDVVGTLRGDLARASTGAGALRALIGEYGSGKTHMLSFLEDEARQRNFVTARVVLNPHDASPANPRRVYRALARSLTLPDVSGGPHGLGRLLEQAVGVREVERRFGVGSIRATSRAEAYVADGVHLYLTPALQYATAARSITNSGEGGDHPLVENARIGVEELLEWLGGSSDTPTGAIEETVRLAIGRNHGRLYSLKDYRPWARIYGYLLSGLAALSRACGYAGLVALVDEAEFYALLDPANRAHARTLFKALAFASLGPRPEDGLDLPFDVGEALSGGGAGVLQRVPGRFGDDAGLYTVFVMTPDRSGLEALDGAVPGDVRLELRRLNTGELEELAHRICTLYREAYPDTPWRDGLEGALATIAASLMRRGDLDNPRQCMRFLVEFLDLQRLRTEAMPGIVADLVERLRGR